MKGAIVVVALGVIAIGLAATQSPHDASPVQATEVAQPPAASQSPASVPQAEVASVAAPSASAVPPTRAPRVETPTAPIPAAVSMAHAREHGDDRTPPLDPVASEQAGPPPTPWDLSDPERYRAYEQREEQRVRAAYLRAAEAQLPVWRAAIEEARARGLSAEDIAAAEEKMQRLEAVQSDLRRDNGRR